jgi:hypothetical protein
VATGPGAGCERDADCATGLVCSAAGRCESDAVVSPNDAGDAGDVADDAGAPGDDAGPDPQVDAGADAGGDGLDAGTDAGGDEVDGGADADAGSPDIDGGADGGVPPPLDAGFDAGADAGFDAGYDAGPDLRSCRTLLASTPGAASGLYTLDPDGAGGAAPYDAYCEMDLDDGGWQLALKADGRTATFGYDDALWGDANLLNATSESLAMEEAKLPPFLRAEVGEVLVVISGATPGAGTGLTDGAYTTLRLEARAGSLRELFAFDRFVPTAAGRASWLAAMPNGALQSNCGAEGFNVDVGAGATYGRVRIGVIGNGEDECLSADSRVGVGGAGDSCGMDGTLAVGTSNHCNAGVDEGDFPAFAAVFVREPAPDDAPTRASCVAHRDASESTGLHWIDPDGVGGAPAVEVWCDMDLGGGGWTLVGRSAGPRQGPFGWTSAWGSPRDDTQPYSLGAGPYGLDISDILVGARGAGKAWGANVYRYRFVPDDYVATYDMVAWYAYPGLLPVVGACAPLEDAMLRHLGWTHREDAFHMRDLDWDGDYGMRADGFNLFYDNCNNAGLLDGAQGMVFVR